MNKSYYWLLLLLALFSPDAFSQSNGSIWTTSKSTLSDNETRLERKSDPYRYKLFDLDLNTLKTQLINAPDRKEPNSGHPVSIDIPTVDGVQSFEVYEASVMTPELQNRFSSIRSYVGQSKNVAGDVIRFSLGQLGFHGMIMSAKNGTQFIDPVSLNSNQYILYKKIDLPAIESPSTCAFEDSIPTEDSIPIGVLNADDSNLRTFRIAISATVEYSRYHFIQAGFTPASPAADRLNAVVSAIAVTLTRNNAIYERELSMEMVLVANNDQLVFIDTDNLSNNDAFDILDENQILIDSVIGAANYDIGHVFTTGAGGLAAGGSVCINGVKAQGVTGSNAPVGDPYDVDFVAHELGHQFGANHTFNGNTGSCQGGNRNANTSYEVGSGTTILAYAGICAPQNVQENSDAYFHQASLNEIWNTINSSQRNCATLTPISNSTPTAEAGPSFTIPANTPYKLTASSTDADGTASHTYTWEQYDRGTTSGLPASTNTTGPLVRSIAGTQNPTRFIPQLSDIVTNGGISTDWEVLPSVTRAMFYRVTVRDNDVRGGQTATDLMRISVLNTAEPFEVTSQNTQGIVWLPNTQETITWDVAGTNAGTIASANVNILLSTDGGENFDTVLASNVPNNGSTSITVPSGIVAPRCRIMVESADNIFFNINSQDFNINANVQVTCNTYASGNLGIVIPDSPGGGTQGTAVRNTIAISDTDVSEEISIIMDVTHPYIGDMLIQVQNPQGEISVLWSNDCVNQDDIRVTFNDNAPAVNCATTTVGPFSPSTPLADLTGSPINGDWIVAMADFGAGDVGAFNSWAVEVCTTTVTALNNPDVDLFRFSLSPNPNNGVFNLDFSTHITGDKSLKLYDLQGKLILERKLNDSASNSIDISNTVANGLYLLEIETNQGKQTKKLIIEK
jgi:subtilisin-like proprotein convertase family protein